VSTKNTLIFVLITLNSFSSITITVYLMNLHLKNLFDFY